MNPAVSHSRYSPAPLVVSDIHKQVWCDIKNILLAFRRHQTATFGQTENAVRLMALLEGELCEDAGFKFVLNDVENESRGDGAWQETPLLQDDEMHLSLVGYFADCPTPIHDFPGKARIDMVLSGRLCIDYYNTGDTAAQSTYPICKLRRAETHHYDVYEASLCFPWQKNLREIHSVTERSIILSAGLKASGLQENSWYLPISPRNTASFFAQRLKRYD